MLGGASPATVRARLEDAFERSQDIGDRRGAAMAAAILGGTVGVEGDHRSAAHWFLRAMDLSRTSGYWHATGWAMMGVTALAGLSGNLAAAARLHGAHTAGLSVLRHEVPPTFMTAYDAALDQVRSQMGERDFDAQCQIGAGLDGDHAIDEAQALARSLAAGEDDPDRPPRRRKRGRKPTPSSPNASSRSWPNWYGGTRTTASPSTCASARRR